MATKTIERHIYSYIKILELFKSLPENTIIIVEGKRDLDALISLTLFRDNIKIMTYNMVMKNISKFEGYNIFILTDFDKKGNSLEETLKMKFNRLGKFRILERERKLFRKYTLSYGEEIHGIFKSLINKLSIYSYDYTLREKTIR